MIKLNRQQATRPDEVPTVSSSCTQPRVDYHVEPRMAARPDKGAEDFRLGGDSGQEGSLVDFTRMRPPSPGGWKPSNRTKTKGLPPVPADPSASCLLRVRRMGSSSSTKALDDLREASIRKISQTAFYPLGVFQDEAATKTHHPIGDYFFFYFYIEELIGGET